MENERCPICQSELRHQLETDATIGKIVKYTCALRGGDHYNVYLNDDASGIDSEYLNIQSKNKKYRIYQYHENNYVIICVFVPAPSGEKFIYNSQVTRNFDKLPFNLLKDDIDKIVKKIQIILTFQ